MLVKIISVFFKNMALGTVTTYDGNQQMDQHFALLLKKNRILLAKGRTIFAEW